MLLACLPAVGQARDPASLSIHGEADGRLAIWLSLPAHAATPTRDEWARIWHALGCQDAPPTGKYGSGCERRLALKGLRATGELDLPALQKALAPLGVDDVTISIALPGRGGATVDFGGGPDSRSSMPLAFPFGGSRAYFWHQVSLPALAPSTDHAPVRIAYGSPLSPWAVILGALAALSPVPLLAAMVAARAPWSRLARLAPVATHLACLAWIYAAGFLGAEEALSIAMGWPVDRGHLAVVLALAIPPLAASIAASLATSVAATRALGLPVEGLSHQLVSACLPLAPIAACVAVLGAYPDAGWPGIARGLGVVALALVLVSLARTGAADPRAFREEEGPFHDHAGDLAIAAGARLRGLYLVPDDLLPAARAFAGRRGLAVSHGMAAALSRVEMEAALALELCRRAPRARGRLLLAGLAGLTGLSCCLPLGILSGSLGGEVAGRIWTSAGAYLLAARWLRRRADLEAVAITSDAEATATALLKTMRLGLLPAAPRMEESMFPVSLALARVAALARAESLDIGAVAARAALDAAPGDRAPWAAALATEDAVFSRSFRGRAVGRYSWGIFVAAMAWPLAAAHGILAAGWDGPAARLAHGGVIVLGPVLLAVALELGVPGFGGARRRLERRLRDQGWSLDGATFVGLSPGPDVSTHEGLYDLDLGYLRLHDDGIAFVGDRMRFNVPRASVTAVAPGPGAPAWWPIPRVHVTLLGGASLHLRPGRGAPFRARADTRRLARTLAAWLAATGGGPAPPDLASLPPPSLGGHEAAPASITASGIATTMLLLVVLGAAFAFLTGLPATPSSAGTGWLVPCSAVLTVIHRLAPTLLDARRRSPGGPRGGDSSPEKR